VSPQDKVNVEEIQSRIVDRVVSGLRARADDAAGYTKSDGKNYGMYQTAAQLSELGEEVQREIEQIARVEAERVAKELRGPG
jgi:hypothetical protein